VVLWMARAVEHAKVEPRSPDDPGPLATAEGLRAFVADLRKGAQEMVRTGWGWMVGGAK
jgi:hypothetical protein